MQELMKFENWKAVRPWDGRQIPENVHTDDENTPVYKRSKEGCGFACGKYYNVGKWEARMENINDSVKYRISLDYSMCGEASKLFAAVFSEDENGRGLTMAYLQPETDRRLSEEYQPAAGAKTLRLEVMFRCFGPGEAYFSEPEVEIRTGTADTVDFLCVGTAYIRPPEDGFQQVGECLPIVEELIERAAGDAHRPDILLFTETALDRYVNLPMHEKCVFEDCDAMGRIRKKARECKMHLIFGIHERTENAFYNTTYVIDDNGEICGKYRKVQITYSELSCGMAPGEELKAIKTRFGKIGVLTCWDAWYPEVARELYKQGARILFCPTAGFPVCCWQSRARENGLPFVSSCSAGPQYSAIYDADGREIVHIAEDGDFVSAVVPMGASAYTEWLGVDPDQSRYGACERNLHIAEIRSGSDYLRNMRCR